MKVKEIIEHLQKLDPELECIYSSDEEGNNYERVAFAPSEVWIRNDGWEFWPVNDEDIVDEGDPNDYLFGEPYLRSSLEKVVCIN